MVYVDPLRATTPTRRWPYKESCHLIADTVDELFAFGDALNLKRRWFQTDHYDLTRRQQDRALRLGAVLVRDRRAFLATLRSLRAGIAARRTEMRRGVRTERPRVSYDWRAQRAMF